MIPWPKILGGLLALAAITWAVREIREDGARSIADAFERQKQCGGTFRGRCSL